jgi:three-Cys-motif partner protein
MRTFREPSNLNELMTTHHFGGSWTDEKLERLARYLTAYTTALKNQRFQKIYIDAFAGTGFRQPDEQSAQMQLDLVELKELAKGSAATALEIDPPFDSFVFIEKHRTRFQELQKLADIYPTKRDTMTFLQADANSTLARICAETDWRRNRAVLFLDPYGTQVEWKTLEKVAATKSIDTWILFPVGMGVDRLLPNDGEVPAAWRSVLDRMLGTGDWHTAFYSAAQLQGDLLDGPTQGVVKLASPTVIERYFLDRLRSIFAGVGSRGLPLRNSRGYLMYLLCFACGSPRGARIATSIANYLLKE